MENMRKTRSKTKKQLIEENSQLKTDLYSIVMCEHKDFQRYIKTRMSWRIIFECEDIVWGGNPNT